MARWSEEAWAAAEPVYEQILEHPFVRALASGELSQERFEFYLRQDALYLKCYGAMLANIASRLDDKAQAESFIRFAGDGVEVERALHASFLGNVEVRDRDMTPACRLYTSVLRSQCLEPVEITAAAVLPCFWVYQRVGEWIYNSRTTAGNTYEQWIATYADVGFLESTRRAIDICDSLAESASEAVRRRMTEVFLLCTRLEWMFWDSAWNLETWKI